MVNIGLHKYRYSSILSHNQTQLTLHFLSTSKPLNPVRQPTLGQNIHLEISAESRLASESRVATRTKVRLVEFGARTYWLMSQLSILTRPDTKTLNSIQRKIQLLQAQSFFCTSSTFSFLNKLGCCILFHPGPFSAGMPVMSPYLPIQTSNVSSLLHHLPTIAGPNMESTGGNLNYNAFITMSPMQSWYFANLLFHRLTFWKVIWKLRQTQSCALQTIS